MDQFIQIKCPFCGAVLKIKQQAGLEKASITCPVCKKKTPFTGFGKVNNGDNEMTEGPLFNPSNPNKEETDIWGSNDKTKVNNFFNAAIGCLVETSGKRWTLRPGVNTVGRKLQSGSQQVDIPIQDYTGERRMSRNHAKVEVVQLGNGAYKHILCNWQNKNETYVGGEVLHEGDRIILQNGMSIRFANIDVKFVIEDNEETTF